jgi:acyl dehydratase
MAEQLFFEDLRSGASWEGPAHTLDEPAFRAFQKLTGDDHPIHYDKVYCERRGHPERIAHGLLVMAQTVLGATPLSPLLHESMVAFLEQSGRFLKPVYLGDTVHGRLTVTELKAQRTTGVVTLRAEVLNQDGVTVLDGRHIYLVRRRGKRP